MLITAWKGNNIVLAEIFVIVMSAVLVRILVVLSSVDFSFEVEIETY